MIGPKLAARGQGQESRGPPTQGRQTGALHGGDSGSSMKVHVLSAVVLALVSCLSKKEQKKLLDAVEHHDEFNMADVEGIGYELVELAYKQKGLPLPESLGGPSQAEKDKARMKKFEKDIDDAAAAELARRMKRDV